MPGHDSPSPFVGPRPFEEGEETRFFAREPEIQALYSFVVSQRAVLLYAASGVGKSSLLAAGLTPALRRSGFEIMPPVRFARLSSAPGNVFVNTALDAWRPNGEPDGGTIAGFLGAREHPLLDGGFAAPRALVFDQFEEVFTQHSRSGRQRDELIDQLVEALAADSLLRVLLVLREEYLAHFEDLASRRLDGVRGRLRLTRLDGDRAFEAVTRPLDGTGVRFADGVAEALVEDLLGGGDHVEPVQLQVVCSGIWTALDPEAKEITRDDVTKYGDVDDTLERFYDGGVKAAAQAAALPEGKLRDAVGKALITRDGTRGMVYRGDPAIPAAALDELERLHVARSIARDGVPWFELAHDRLIEPVRESNRKFRQQRDVQRGRRRWTIAVVAIVLLAGALVTTLLVLNDKQQQVERAKAVAQAPKPAVPAAVIDPRLLLTLHPRDARTIAFAAEGQVIATGAADGTVTLFNTDTGFRAPAQKLFDGAVTSLAARGTEPIVAGSATGRLAVVRVDIPAKPVLLDTSLGPLTQVTASETAGQVGAVGRYGAVVWDWQKDEARRLVRNVDNPLAARFHSGAVDIIRRDGTWLSGTPSKLKLRRSLGGSAVAAAFDPAGNLALVRSNGTLVIVSPGRRRTIKLPPPGPAGVALAVTDGLVAVGGSDGIARVVETSTGRVVGQFDTRRPPIRAVALDGTGYRLATVGDDGTLHEWSLASGSSRVVGIARGQLGARYAFGGTLPGEGFDSSGLVKWVFTQVGATVPRQLAQQARAGRPVSGTLRPGDLLFFKAGNKVVHVGIYVGDSQYIHADPNSDVVLTSLRRGYLGAQYATARRLPTTSRLPLVKGAAPAPTATATATPTDTAAQTATPTPTPTETGGEEK